MKRKWSVALCLALVLTAAVLAAPASAANPKIGVLIFDYANNYVSYIRNSINQVAGDSAEVLMVDAQNDQAKQVEQVDTVISRGVDALAVNAVSPEAAPTIIEKARAAGLPIVFFNRSPSKEDMLSYEKCWYVGTTPYDSGLLSAEMAMSAFKADPKYDKNKDGVLQYLIIKGTPGHPDAEARTLAVQETFAKAGFKTELLDIQTGNFRTADAKDVMDAWIGKFGDKIEMVLANNDALLLGCVESLKGEGYLTPEKPCGLIGINALPEVLPLIADGTVLGSILSDAYSEGKNIFIMCFNAATGKDVLAGVDGKLDDMKAIRVPYIPIDKSNIPTAQEIYKYALGK
ncbi:MAG: galactose ABC transporter substrate-binding protein [Synergistaceae bacterium]|jgi:methyl-galactoside transport system substrate-binding protein|nr:galactose ABC transporter substrate-binding protein [Synergistaceae bacterium]